MYLRIFAYKEGKKSVSKHFSKSLIFVRSNANNACLNCVYFWFVFALSLSQNQRSINKKYHNVTIMKTPFINCTMGIGLGNVMRSVLRNLKWLKYTIHSIILLLLVPFANSHSKIRVDREIWTLFWRDLNFILIYQQVAFSPLLYLLSYFIYQISEN